MTKEQFDAFMEKYENSSIIEKFIKHAGSIHDIDVNQKYDGDIPYSAHLDGVYRKAIEFGYLVAEDESDIIPILFGAMFHDSIEDARLTYNDVMKIAKNYMSDEQAFIATEIVYALTNEKGRNRAERANDKYYAGIRDTKYAPFVKMCDRMANMEYSWVRKSRMLDVYRKELPAFIEKLQGIEATRIPQEMIDKILTF